MTNIKLVKILNHPTFIFLTIILLLCSLPIQSQVFFNDLENTKVEGNWIGLNTVDSGYAYSGIRYSKTDYSNPYGLGIEQKLPESLARANTIVLISGQVVSNEKNNHALFVVTLVKGNETLLWKGIPLAPVLEEKHIWSYFSDSVLIPANLTAGSKLKAYLWNQDKNNTTGIDDLRVEFKKFKNPTFVPEISDLSSGNSIEESSKLLFENRYYKIIYKKDNQGLKIIGNNGNEIIKHIRYYDERNIKGNKSQDELIFQLKNTKTFNNGKVISLIASDLGCKINLTLTCNNYNPEIDVDISEKYRKTQKVYRESIVFNYSPAITSVYRNNRRLDTSFFQKEYWLDKQGVRIGKGNNSFNVYHTPGLSSLQLDTYNKLIYANLDFEKDHPFFRFPLNPDSSDWKKEESFSRYKKGDQRNYRFKLTVGNNIPTIPRFMKNPSGFEATYIWTEHADYSDIRTNRATYFGSENVSDADSAIGGFVKYNIPVTKSVFYDNPDSITNYDASKGLFTTLESTILVDSLFSEFLLQIAEKGSEICLHTPEQFTTTPQRLEEALAYMKNSFNSPSWIDHGNNNGPQNNREDLICDATLEDSPFYTIDLWKKYGVKYLHNAYYEELNTYKGWQFEKSLEKPYSGFGDFFPKPDYYYHPTRTKDLVHWTTTSAMFIKEPYLWDYLFKYSKLYDLVKNRAVEMNHVYPAWVDPKKGMWTYDSDSVIVAQPGFNMALSNMDKLRNEGKLNICTIEDFLNYRTAIDDVAYYIMPDGRVRLSNNGESDISGLSMVAKASAVTVEGTIPNQKKVGDEIIFWFDIEAGESKVIRVVE